MRIFGKIIQMPRSKRSKAKGWDCMTRAGYLMRVANTYHREEDGRYTDTGTKIIMHAANLIDRAARYYGFADSLEMDLWHYNL